MNASGIAESFDAVVLPHLGAGYRLARRLMGDEHDAEDVMQEASLRAFRYFRTFCGGDGRAWFLRIVRNTCYGWRRRGLAPPADSFDEAQHSGARPPADPEALLLQTDRAASIVRAMRGLPDHFHQVLVLREIEDLSYRELAEAIGVPLGTVMSRLSRAREALRGAVDDERQDPRFRRRQAARYMLPTPIRDGSGVVLPPAAVRRQAGRLVHGQDGGDEQQQQRKTA